MTAPAKPFPTYKWRWLSVQPSEGLLEAPVFLGVLRALQHHEGDAYSSIELHRELQRVQQETSTNINLARTPERNLFRNSGQYWRGTGLLIPKTGEIELTPLGHRVASGQITNDEFAALMVRNTMLPNPQTYSESEMAKWREAELRIKPFELMLSVMDKLGRATGLSQAHLTANELIYIIIPLAGAKASPDEITEAVASHRIGRLDINDFPDCAPAANDKRLAREFLLFLENFGICQAEENANNYEQRFMLDEVFSLAIASDEQVSFLEDGNVTDDEVSTSRDSEIPIIIERRRIATNVIQRPNQSRFRKDVLRAAQNQCVMTQETTSDVIEAAHIIPVGHGGTDSSANGLCMRVDIHRLFDNGKIRIAENGAVTLHEQIADAISYQDLPSAINFPASVDRANVRWRSRYL
jgi:HNH endonuclease